MLVRVEQAAGLDLPEGHEPVLLLPGLRHITPDEITAAHI